MGCAHSKTSSGVGKKKKKKEKERDKALQQKDQSVRVPLEGQQALKVLQDILMAPSSKDREVLLGVQQGELLQLVQELVKKVVEERTEELNRQFQMTISGTEEAHRAKEKELQQAHDKEKKSMRDKFEETEVQLRGQVEELTELLGTFKELQQRVAESALKTHLQVNIQTHGSPGEFWDNELESLLFVIEMKSERLREKEQALMQMETLVERNASLEEQLARVVQQNEDLQVRNSNHQSHIQQLYAEVKLLTEAQEKESVMTQKLLQEKEQLLYKLQQEELLPPCHKMLSSVTGTPHLCPADISFVLND